MIVDESKNGEKEQEEAEASVLWNRLTDYNKGAKEDDYLVDEELKALIVEESKKGEKDLEEEE